MTHTSNEARTRHSFHAAREARNEAIRDFWAWMTRK